MRDARPMRDPRALGLGYLGLPALLTLISVAAYLAIGTVFLSLSRLDYSFRVVPWPPSLAGFASFLQGIGGRFLADGIVFAARGALLSVIPGLVTGYYLALKAPRAIRRLGVFLLLSAWALTFERIVAFVHFSTLSPFAGWFPWLAVEYGVSPDSILVWVGMPPMGLACYAAFRGRFFGVVWPSFPGPRLERWLREALPRGIVGAALGLVLTAATFLIDPTIPRIYAGPSARVVSVYLASVFLQFGYVTLAAVIVVLLGGVVVAGYLAFGAVLKATHWVSVRWLPRLRLSVPRLDDRALSLASSIVTGLVAAFCLVSLFLPLFVAAVFSFNYDNNMIHFSTWSTRWWFTSPAAVPSVNSLFSDSYYLTAFGWSPGLSAIVAAPSALVALLAALALRHERPRSRVLMRATLYFGIVAPIYLVWASSMLRATWDQLAAASGDLTAYAFLAVLPFAVGLAFAVSQAALYLPGDRRRPATDLLELRAGIAAFLVALGFLTSSLLSFTGGYNVPALVYSVMTRRIPTPELDAAITLLSLFTIVPLAAAFVVIEDRESFTL